MNAPLRLQTYVLVRALGGVAAALGVVASVIVLVDFVELSRTLGARVDLGFLELLSLTMMRVPAVLMLLAPFVFLFGIMGAYVALNRRSELVAMRAAGVSAWRFILPAAGAATLIGLVAITVLNPIASDLNARFEESQSSLIDSGHGREIWLRQGGNGRQIVIHAKTHDTAHDRVRLTGVSLFVQSVGLSGNLDFSRRIEAAQALLLPGSWRLTDVNEAMPGAELIHSEQLSIPSTLDSRTAMERFASPGAVAFWDLPATIREADLAGYSAAAYRMRLQQLLATPLMFSAMTILAAAFSLRLTRLGNLARLAGLGVGLGFAVYFLGQFCAAMGKAEVIPPFVAGWAPPLLALLSGVTLLCYTEDG